VLKEIERPLGQGLPPLGKPQHRLAPSKGAVVSTLAVAGILAISTVIALRKEPIDSPTPVAVADPAPAETAEPAEAPAVEIAAASKPEGPSIIHVQPNETAGKGVITFADPSAANFDPRTAHLPDRNLIENSPEGPLPKRGADGRRPADAYARPWSGARGARVAIVIGGLAVSQTGTQSAISKLPPEVTLAFASQGNSIQRWMQAARQEGHEILMQVPLEPFDYPTVNPGRATLTVEASPQENIQNLHWALARTTNYTGVMNYMGGRFVADGQATGAMMAELGKRGLLYLDDGTSARSTAPDQAAKNGVPIATGDMVIDDARERGAILKKLDQLEATARAKGFAIGTGSAFDQTVDAVASWVNEAKKRGIEIVPISAVTTDSEKS
jgi:polysaccharide deacetylase 2 family uncharacterized protein YibQ